jgi:uncharacterized protein YggE
MKRQWILPLLILASALLAGCTALAGAPAPAILSTSGLGSVTVVPDMVNVNLGVQTQGQDVSQTVRENNTAAQAVIDAVKGQGVEPGDVQSTYFSVWSQPRYDEFGNPTSDVTYTVDHTVTVRLRDTAKLGGLLQAAIDAGANNIQGVTFGVQDPTAAQDQARQLAMQDGQARAALLAQNAGLQLGRLKSVSTTLAPLGPSPYPVYAEGIGGGGVPTVPGTQEVQVQVYLEYEIE